MNRLETMMAEAIAKTKTEDQAIVGFSVDLLAANDAALIWEVFSDAVRRAALLRLARHVAWLAMDRRPRRRRQEPSKER